MYNLVAELCNKKSSNENILKISSWPLVNRKNDPEKSDDVRKIVCAKHLYVYPSVSQFLHAHTLM